MKPLTLPILIACGADPKFAPRYLEWLNILLPEYSINTHLRVSHWLAQCLHESDDMRATTEYASGIAYEGNVRSLGNTQKGDGPRFRGRGSIQCTGRTNYTAFARKFGIDAVNHPELLEQPKWWVASGLWYWDARRLNIYADRNDIWRISCIINIGHIPKPTEARQLPNGWVDRQRNLARCKLALAPLFAVVTPT